MDNSIQSHKRKALIISGKKTMCLGIFKFNHHHLFSSIQMQKRNSSSFYLDRTWTDKHKGYCHDSAQLNEKRNICAQDKIFYYKYSWTRRKIAFSPSLHQNCWSFSPYPQQVFRSQTPFQYGEGQDLLIYPASLCFSNIILMQCKYVKTMCGLKHE